MIESIITIRGNVGEIKFEQSKPKADGSITKYVKFSLAQNEGTKNADGTWNNVTTWYSCIAFGKQAEDISAYCSKGEELVVSGKFKSDVVEKDGVKTTYLNIIADLVYSTIRTLGKAKGIDVGNGSSTNNAPKQNNQTISFTQDDDLPF